MLSDDEIIENLHTRLNISIEEAQGYMLKYGVSRTESDKEKCSRVAKNIIESGRNDFDLEDDLILSMLQKNLDISQEQAKACLELYTNK